MNFPLYENLNRFRSLLIPSSNRPSGWLSDALVRKVDQARILFIHVPKTGGTSVSQFLYRVQMPHYTLRNLRFYHPLHSRKWLKFAVLRDPVDRFLSSYDYLSRGGTWAGDAVFARQYVQPFPDVNLFAAQFLDPAFRRAAMAYFHFEQQAAYICAGGRCLVNRLARFERLDEDCSALLGTTVDLPRLNVTPDPRTPPEALSPQSMEILQQIYASDFRLRRLASGEASDFFCRRY